MKANNDRTAMGDLTARVARVGQRSPAAGVAAPAGGSRLIRMIIKSLSVGGVLHDDHVVCYRKDDAAKKAIVVAKPWDLQKTPWHGKTLGGISYNYLTPILRRATAGTQTQDETIKPPYEVGRELVVGYGIEGGTSVGGETVGAQKLADSSFNGTGGWLFDPDSGWFLLNGRAVHPAGSGAGRIYSDDEWLVPSTLYDVVLNFAGSQTGSPLRVFCGSESAEITSSIAKRIRCQSNGIFAIQAALDTGVELDFATCTVVEPAGTPWQDANFSGRQWYRLSEE